MYHLVISGLQGQTLGQYRLQGGQGARIQALDNVYYQIGDAASGLAPESLQTARAGNDLLVYLQGEATPGLIIENYYLLDDAGLENPLLGLNSSGQYVAYPLENVTVAPVHQLAGEMVSGSALPMSVLAGVGLAGAAIAGNRGESFAPLSHNGQPQTPFHPDQPALPPAGTPLPPLNNTLPPPSPPGSNNPPPANHAPTGIMLSNTRVIEGKAGVVIGKLATIDPDRGDTHIYSINDPRFEVVNSELKLKAGQALHYGNGKEILLAITTTDQGGKSHSESFTLQVQDDPGYPPPAANHTGSIRISGEAKVGKTLLAMLHDDDGFDANAVQYQWFANGQAIRDAVGSRYVPTRDDIGKTLSVQATYTDNGKVQESVTSPQTSVIADDTPAPPPPPPANAGLGVHVPKPATSFVANAKDYGAKGDGQSDDTAAIQKAIDAVAAKGGGIVDIPDGRYLVDAEGGIRLRSHVIVRMADGTVLKAKANAAASHEIIHIHNVTDAHVLGGTLEGERSEHQGTHGEWGMGIRITAATNVVIEKVTVREMWGDGIYLGKAANYPVQNENIVIYGVNMDHNRRQGISVTQARGLKILNSILQNTDGTEPRSGIDLEPNANENVSDVEIRGNTFANNQIGFLVANHRQSNAWVKNVIFEDNILRDNPRDAIILRGLEGGSIRNNTIHIDPDAHPHDSGGIRLYNGEYHRTTGVDIIGNTLYGGEILPRDTSGNTIADNRYKAAVFIRGEAKVGQTLTAAVYDGDKPPKDGIRYRWFAGDKEITDAAGQTYTVRPEDAGKAIRVEVTFTDGAGQSESAQSVRTLTVPGHPPANHTPSGIGLSANGLPENKAGAVVGKVTVTDPDQGDTHNYTVSDSRFEINAQGNLKLKDGVKIEFAQEPQIDVNITVTDQAGSAYHESFTLHVQDDPAYPAPPAQTNLKESGLNLDMARHFYTLPTLKAFVDTLAKAGGTFFHLHFSDDENYALESALLGQTTANASQRADGTWISHHTKKPFLGSAQIAELVDYARSKNIALVPELDMPAHIKGVLDLLHHAHGADYVKSVQVDWTDRNGNPVHQLDVKRPEVRTLAKALIDEIAAYFKHARHFHIGGDEFQGGSEYHQEYLDFANDLAAHLAGKNLKTRMWNDGIRKTALGSLNKDIEITYWSLDGEKQGAEAEFNRAVRAKFTDFTDAGFKILNYNADYLYHNPESHHYSSLSQSDHEMYTRLKGWHLGIWDGTDSTNAVSDSSKIAGAAMSIWSKHAGELHDASIEKFTENQLGAIIRMVNAAADPQSADAQALKALQDALRGGDYSGMEHPVYLDLERAPQAGSLDTGALGKQHIHLLRQDLLDDRGQFEFFIRGDQHDTLTLTGNWQKTEHTVTLQNPEYAADMVTYRAYAFGDDKLWVDEDLRLYWI